MTTITREQAQKIIDAADNVITALAGTNDDFHPDNSEKMCGLWDDLNDRYAPPEVVRELARAMLASMDAEPAGYHVIRECGKVGCSVATLEEAEKTRDFWNKRWTIRPYFYSAAPAPVVPEEHYQRLSELYHAQEKRLFKIAQRIKGPAFDKYSHSPSQAIDVLESALFGENEATCRAAMLNGGKS